MNSNKLPGEPVAWHSIFCPRPAEMTALQAAYEAAAAPRPRAGVVVLLSESGLGKTRLLQEFFHWLSTTKDGAGDAGYWPDVLARHGDNLRIDPDPGACHHQVPLPFLWWGVRLPDPGRHNAMISSSLLASSADHFEPHVEPMLRARRRAERGAERRRSAGDLVVEALLEALGQLVPGVSLAKAGVAFTRRMSRLWSEQRVDNKAPLSPGEINESERRSLCDRYLNYLHALLDARQGFDRSVPFVLVIDDAQWATQDPALVDLIDRLLPAARDKRWPLLLVVTHWEAEWNSGSAMRAVIERHAEPGWRPLKLSPHPDLSACVGAAFPGLTREQVEVVLDKAGGNPRLLDEILRWLLARPRFFVDRNSARELTPEGEAAVKDETFKLHSLVEARLNAAPPEIKATLAVSGLQGMRFLTALTEEVFHALHMAHSVHDAVARAEHPYCFVVRYGDVAAEFAQRVFYDVAVAGLPDVVDADAARAALAAAVRNRIEGWHEQLPASGIAETLAVAALVFEHDPKPESRLLAAHALAGLTSLAAVRWDYHAAHAAARRFEAGRLTGQWRMEDLDVWQLVAVLDALCIFEPPDRTEDLAAAILQRARALASEPDTVEARRTLSVSLDRAGYIAETQGKFAEAEAFYREGLGLTRELAGVLRTPDARRDALALLSRVGDLANSRGKFDEADSFYCEGLNLARWLADELQTPQARRDLSGVLAGAGDIAHAQGKLQKAEKHYREGLQLRRRLAEELQKPQARRDVSGSCIQLVHVVRAHGKLDEAEKLYREGLELRRRLAGELQTPQAQRDLAESLDRVGDIAREQGKLGTAETLCREALDIASRLSAELRTPRARREFSISLDNLGRVVTEQGKLKEAETLYREALDVARQLVGELRTPDTRRGLFVSLQHVGDVARAQGKLNEAETLYSEGCNVAKALADELQTPQARRDMSTSLERAGDVALDRGKLEEAETLFREGLDIARRLANELQTTEAQQDVSVSLRHLGDVARRQGKVDEAETLYREGLGIARRLADEVWAPTQRRDLMLSFNNVGDVTRDQRRHVEAETLYREGLGIARSLADELQTPQAQRDVSASLDRIGCMAVALGRLAEAETLYREGLECANTYRQQQPSPDADADAVVARFKTLLHILHSDEGKMQEVIRLLKKDFGLN